MEHTQFAPDIAKINHNAGFFSCCSVRLGSIVHYFNKEKQLPKYVDSSTQFRWYKELNTDVTFQYFKHYNEVENDITYTSDVDYHDTKQFGFYKDLDFEKINPLIEKYFSPSKIVQTKIDAIIKKYDIDFENTCTLFHRGLDKVTETEICSYEDKLEKAKELLKENPNIHFLIQSDETGFIEKARETFPDNSFYCKDEIFHMEHDSKTLIDHKYRDNPEDRAQNLLAVLKIMSKCKHVIVSSGNCDIWTILFRGNTKNVTQFFKNEWVKN
jgi:hypothetical protein